MKKFSTHLLSLVLILALLCAVMVMPAMAEETDAVKIGTAGYSDLASALTEAATMTGDVTVEIYDKVTLNSSLSGSYDSIMFVGKDTDAEIYLDVQGYITASGKNVAFEDLTLSKSTGGFITNAGFMNVAFGVYEVAEVTYTNCTFANGAYASSGKVTFSGCTFKRSHDKYGLWAYGSNDIVVDGCTFADYRGIKMYDENKGANNTTVITVKNTNFSAVNDKPAIVLTYGKSVTLEGNTYSNTGVFELDLDGKPNGTPVTSDVAPSCKNDNGACGVLVDGKIYTTVAQAAEVATSGSVITLLHDSTETLTLPAGVSLEKNAHTADGVEVTDPVAYINSNIYTSLQAAISAAKDGDTIQMVDDAQGSGIVINKDVTIDFGNFTYTFTKPAVGSNGTESNGFQILKDNNVTLQNGTLNVDAAYADKYYILIQNYANLNVTNMVLDGTNLDKWSKTDGDSYVLSNNCGNVNINGNTSIIANDDGSLAYAVDAHLKSGYTAPTVTIDTTGTINGKIEISGGTMIVENGTFHARKVNGAYTDTDVFVVSSGLLTINNAAVDGGDMEDTTAVWAHTSGKAVINGGSFTLSGKNVTNGHNDMIYAGKTNDGDGAVIEVNGGTFSATDVKNPGTNSANVWLLNENDGQGSMTVSGGIFEGFNPGAVYTELAQPTSFLANGYCVNENGTTYTVGVHNSDRSTFDAESHWRECTNCGEKVNKEAHTIDTNSWGYGAEGHWHGCQHCSYETTHVAHNYNREVIFEYNLKNEDGCNTYYWLVCECGRRAGNEEDSASLYFAVSKENPVHSGGTATCTEKAVCVNCGEKYGEALGHTEETLAAKAPTCTEDGLTEGKKCTVCGITTVAQNMIPATGHTEVAVPGKAATCTETGLTEGKKCSVCGTVTKAQETIAALGHKLETVEATEATYFAPGNIAHSKCSVCGKLFDAEGKELTAADVIIAQLIKVEETKAEVSTDVIDNAIKESETAGTVNIVINVTKDEMVEEDTTTPGDGTTAPAPVITKTELPVASVEQVADLHEEATLTVSMTNATVTLDKTALEVVAEAAKVEETDLISLEIEHIETETLAPAQQEAIEDKEVAAVISASILVNGTEVHDFQGGEVTVAIPFTPAEGTEGSDYVVLYIADDGTVEEIPTVYENGVLTMTLSHFSEYVVVNTNVTAKPPVDPDMPTTGDDTNLMLLGSVLVLSLAGLAVVVLNKKKFLA